MKKSEALHILGLDDTATEEEIKKAHRKLIIENHPDKFAQDETLRAEAEEKTKKINEAADVLESGKWEPEFGSTGNPYASPFTYTQTTSQGSGNDPFKGTPFEGFVWTTYTTTNSQGQTNTNSSNPFGYSSDPFVGYSSPFAAAAKAAAEANRPENRLKRQKEKLNKEIEVFIVKVVILALCVLGSVLTGNNEIAMGMYLYTIITIGQAIMRNLGILSGLVMVPFIMLALIFAPGANAVIGVIGLFAFIVALATDISRFREHYLIISELKEQINRS
ncbi:MAG: J domain-containing protein [Anaerotardibacter sp.]